MRCVSIEHALALLARATDDLYVLRYEDVIDDQSPAVDAVWCEALVTRTIDWAVQQLSEKDAQ